MLFLFWQALGDCLPAQAGLTVISRNNIGGSSNGRTVAFEAINLGPIPSPPAKVGSIEAT